jgi:protein-S-isoprenylcysteine O-methyltransferase Ste14
MADPLGKSFALVAGLGLCLFGSAGTLAWRAGWGVLGAYTLFVIAALVIVDNGLIRERAKPSLGFDPIDAILGSNGFLLLYPIAMAVAGLDAVRWGGSSRFPGVLQVTGSLGFAAGYGIVLWAMHTNRFFSTFVRIQTERGHTLVSGGPYALVRHPGYAGMLLAHWAMPLALRSAWAFVPVALGTGVFVARILREERTLAKQLPGYADYRQLVSWRLAPGVW